MLRGGGLVEREAILLAEPLPTRTRTITSSSGMHGQQQGEGRTSTPCCNPVWIWYRPVSVCERVGVQIGCE